MEEGVQAQHIVQPVQIAQDVDIAIVAELVGFVEVVPKKHHLQTVLTPKTHLKDTNPETLINPQKSTLVNRQKFLLIK